MNWHIVLFKSVLKLVNHHVGIGPWFVCFLFLFFKLLDLADKCDEQDSS